MLPLRRAQGWEMRKLAVFGDSHYACVRQAHAQDLVDVAGVEVEYWGHVGSRFNFLDFKDGAIVPKDDFTAQRFAKFNEKGRLFLPVADFDMVLFMGARIDVTRLVAVMLRQAGGSFVSAGLRRRMVRDRLEGLMAYGFAKSFAATKTAQVVISPVPFPTEGYRGMDEALTPTVRTAAAAERAEIWAVIVAAAAEDGIVFLPQPEETVTGGCFTSAAYAVDRFYERDDYAHRNAAYGALVLSDVLGRLCAKAPV